MTAPAAELATMYVSIVPSFAGGSKSIDSQLGPALKAAGTKAGKDFASSFSKQEISAAQVKKFSADVEAASAKVTAARQKEEDASGALRVAEARLSEVRANGKATTSQVIAAEERVAAAARKVAAAQSAAKGPATALASAQKNLESATAEAGKSSESAAADYAKGWAGLKARMGNFIKGSVASGVDDAEKEAKAGGKRAGDSYAEAFKVGIAAIGTAAGIGTVAGLADEALAAGKGSDRVAAALGLNPADAQRAGSVAGSLFAGAYGDSMDDASGAVEAVMSSIKGMRNASNADLESMTAKVLDLSSAFEIDTGRAAQVAGQMITSGLAKDGTEAADLLAGSLQKVPKNVREDLLDAVDEYAPFMKSLGITGSDAMGMLVASSEKGMYGIDKTGDALKEFGIRATDMSKATSGAYDALGLDQEGMTAKLLAGGDTAKGAFAQIVNGLSSMSDPVAQSQAALALFGTPLEDLSVSEIPGFLGAIDPMGDAFDSMKGKAGELGTTLADNAGTKIESWKRSAQVAFVDILGNKVLPILENVGGWLGQTFGPILDEVKGGITAFGAAWVANDGDITSSGFPGFMEGLAYQLRQAFDYVTGTVIPKLQEFGKFLWDNRAAIIVITAAVGGYAATIGTLSIISTVRGWITGAASAQWGLNAAMTANPIGIIVAAIAALVAGLIWFFTQTDLGKQIIANAWAWIQGAISAVVSWFQNTAMPIIQQVFAVIGAVFTWLYENIIKPVWDGIVTVINAGWLVIRGIFQLVQSVIQNVIGPIFNWLWTTVIQPVFGFIGGAISFWWNNIVSPVFRAVWGFIQNTLGPIFNWLWNTIIKPAFDGIGTAIKWVWENVIKPVFDTLSGFIQKTIPKAFETGVGFVKTAWDKLQEIAKAPVKFVVNTVINDGLIGAFNTVAGILPGIDKLPRVALPPGFYDGGYTGRGRKKDPAGIVHAGEIVWSQDDIRRHGGVGAVEGMRRGAGHADGGRVAPLKQLAVTQGYNRTHKGIDYAANIGTPVYATQNGVVNWAGPGARTPGVWGGNEIHILGSGLETWFAHLSSIGVKLGQNVRAGQQIGLSGNTGISSGPHLHFGVFQGGWPNDIDPNAYLGGAGTPSGGPFNPVTGIIDGLMNKFKEAFPQGGMLIDIIGGIGKKILASAADVITNIFGGSSDGAAAGAAISPTVFDGGGWLENTGGVQLVQHNQSKPDAVLSHDQWQNMRRIADDADRTPRLPSRLTLMVGGRAFDAYVSELADQSVQTADAQSQYLRRGR